MSSIVDDCVHHCILPDGQSALYDELAPFDEDIAGDVTTEELTLSPTPAEVLDEAQNASGSSLPATPAERPCTFCPSALPLPPATCPNRATLVLDLDGTLIASEELNAANSTYLWNPHGGARSPDYEAMGRRVWLRPGVKEFLVAVRPHFEIVLFTAATQNWAAAAIEQLDPAAELFDVMLHRDHTTSDLMWDYVKDLSRLGRDLARVVIVDDNPLMFMYQPDNALHVAAYEASTAGGPDNVLERVAELLISQVAAAEDVREILGPMSSAKSCIVSTVSASNALELQKDAAKVQAVSVSAPALAAEAAVVGAADGAAAQLDGSWEGVAATAGADVVGMACEQSCEATTWISIGLEGEGCGEAPALGAPQRQVDPQHSLQYQHQEVHTGACGDGYRDGGGCANSGSFSAEDTNNWDSESEGAETFDANGAAAQLGADVKSACHRQGGWAYDSGHVAGLIASDERQADAALSAEAREPEESDAAVPSDEQLEEQSEHTSEDFEALMEDAIAEYDSDAHEDRYDPEIGYEGACPASAADVAAAVTATTFGSFSRLSSRNCCNDGGVNVAYAFTCKLGYGTNGVQGCTDGGPRSSAEGSLGATAAGTPESGHLVCAGVPLVAVPGFADSSYLAPSSTDESAQATHGGGLEAADPQPRLPTGMVFLTDLNPAFGAGCSSLEAPPSHGDDTVAKELSQTSAVPPAELCAHLRSGFKRTRDDSGGGVAAEGNAAAVTAEGPSCDADEQPCCRPRLGVTGEQCPVAVGKPRAAAPAGPSASAERTV